MSSLCTVMLTRSIATNLNPGWGQATQTTEIQIDGNNTLEYANLNYQGLEYPQQMFQPWNMCIWTTRPMTLPRLIFF